MTMTQANNAGIDCPTPEPDTDCHTPMTFSSSSSSSSSSPVSVGSFLSRSTGRGVGARS
jgi:hypothetical protein